jgi:DNA-binding MarR family transcriptional regulator
MLLPAHLGHGGFAEGPKTRGGRMHRFRAARSYSGTSTWGGSLEQPTRKDFENLLAFRVSLRRFQRWSEDQSRAVGLTHVQHQLLVAVKGHHGDLPPTIGELATYLLLRHHSAVELVDRAEVAGFVRRCPDARDARVVRVELTRKGDQLVTDLTQAHLAELHNLAAALNNLLPS